MMYQIEFPEEYETLFESQCTTLKESLYEYFFGLDDGTYDVDSSFKYIYSNIYNSFDANTQSKINGIIEYRKNERNKIKLEFTDCIEKMKMLNIEFPHDLELEYVVTYYSDDHAKGYVITPILNRSNASHYFDEESDWFSTDNLNVSNTVHGCCKNLYLNLNNGRDVPPYSLVLHHDD